MNFDTDLIDLLPNIERCEKLDLGEGQVLITVGGFEDRAFAAAESFGSNIPQSALVLDYRPHDEKNRLSELIDSLKKAGVPVSADDVLEYDRFEPHRFPEKLEAALRRLNATGVVVDISAMSKLAILLCLYVAQNLNLNTSIFYAEAVEYSPSEEHFEEAKRSESFHRPSVDVFTGIQGVIRVGCLSSVAMQGQPTVAIAFMSPNEMLIQALVNTVYPSKLFLINGRPPELAWREKAIAWIHEKLRVEWGDDNPVEFSKEAGVALPTRVVSTLDYRETVAELIHLYWELAVSYRILLAPTGSKMQTVGVFLAKAFHPDIHIEYPTPHGFFPEYSKGIGAKWFIRFGALDEFVTLFKSQEKKEKLGLQIPVQ